MFNEYISNMIYFIYIYNINFTIIYIYIIRKLLDLILATTDYVLPDYMYRPNGTKEIGLPSIHVIIATLFFINNMNIWRLILLLLIMNSRYYLKKHNLLQIIIGFIFGYYIGISI